VQPTPCRRGAQRLRVAAMVPSWIRPEGLNLQKEATKEPVHDYCRQTQSGTTRLVPYKAIPEKMLQEVCGVVSALKGSQRWSNKECEHRRHVCR